MRGFTLVELIIVIVIIGILASVTVVGYQNQTSKARDTVRKSDLTQIYKALQVRNVERTGTFAVVGSGASGAGLGGFWDTDYDNAGPYTSFAVGLVDDGTLPRKILDPLNRTLDVGIYSRYMLLTNGIKVSIYGRLENMLDIDGDTWDDASSSGVNMGYHDGYGMNYRVGNGY